MYIYIYILYIYIYIPDREFLFLGRVFFEIFDPPEAR